MSKPQSFKKLQAEWYKKLENEGFGDQEYPDGTLKYVGTGSTNKNSGVTIEGSAKEEYFRIAGFFLYDHTFKDETEKEIWKYHSEGMTYREIYKKFSKVKGVKYIIYRLKAKMMLDYSNNIEEAETNG